MTVQTDRSQLPGRRIIILGSTGAGKTTLSRQLSERCGLIHIELDALHWETGWKEAELPLFRARVQEAIQAPAWVLDGNYSKVRDLTWGAADLVLWLDYSLPVVLWRLLWRTLQRTLLGVELWNGNRERFADQFFSRDSLLLYALTSHRRHRRNYPSLLQRPEFAHLKVVRLRSPGQTRAWLAETTG